MTRRMGYHAAMGCAVLGIWLFLAGGALGQTSSTAETTVSKQLAIMSRIIEKRLGEEFKEKVITSSMLSRGVQGFYVRGVGAFFFVDVKFPVAQPPAEDKPSRPSNSKDLWERYEREMEGAGSLRSEEQNRVRSTYSVTAEGKNVTFLGGQTYDGAKVERLKTVLFDVLAEYGRRLTALAEGERIVVVVSGSVQRPLVLKNVRITSTPYGGNSASEMSANEVVLAERPGAAPEWPAVGSVLIISAGRKDLTESASSLAKQATVQAYMY